MSLKQLKLLDPENHRVFIGDQTYHCCNADCQDSRWPDGTRRLLEARHFTPAGRCKNHKSAAKG